MKVVFDFAARKVSRHQLYKHVNAHVYLGVWRITLNSVSKSMLCRASSRDNKLADQNQ